jgi:hypothetical protein
MAREASSPPAAARIFLGKYELCASLGQGGMADVFLAVASFGHGVKKLAVIKRPRMDISEDERLKMMFLDEARLAARLNHPNVVQTYEAGEHERVPFLAMEFLEGQPLNRILKELVQKRLDVPLPMMMRIASDALAGLHYAHELRDYDGKPLKIIHRDVSPQNVFVTYDGHVKLVDFGVAKAVGNASLTDAGAIKGKVAYMAPEQAREEELDRRADVFAMGVVCWELATKRRLFAAETSTAILYKVLNEDVPRVSSLEPRADAELDGIIARALERDPARRYQTALEMREALERWIARTGTMVLPDAIGGLVSTMFGTLRAEVAAKVRAHMARPAAAPAPAVDLDTAVLALGRLDLGGGLSAKQLPPHEVSAGGSLAAGISAIKQELVPRRRYADTLVRTMAVTALVLGVVAGAVLIAGRGQKTAAASPNRASAHTLHDLARDSEELAQAADLDPDPPPRGQPRPAARPRPDPRPDGPAKPRRQIDTNFPTN